MSMRSIKLLSTIFAIALFSMACNSIQRDETADTDLYPNKVTQQEFTFDANNYNNARENLDLQVIGALLERADDAQELEYLLNSDNRINNLDLNRDGYVDYISVAEFEDRNDGERGLSLFSRFGPDLIQEIATIIFDRGGLDASGARILLAGNEQLYGDNYYYEANWLDRALPIVSWLFSDRDSNYSSPYYYGNYPDYYETYQVVETPVYRTRVEQVYSEPVFIQTTSPAINEIEIRSPYEGKTIVGETYPKPAKPTKEQVESSKNNPDQPEFVPVKKDRTKEVAPKIKNQPKGNPNDFERPLKSNNEKKANSEKVKMREKPNNIRRETAKPSKLERPSFNLPRPEKIERPNMKPPKADKPGRGDGGGKKPKHDNGGKGSGKGNGGAGGKGGGKKN